MGRELTQDQIDDHMMVDDDDDWTDLMCSLGPDGQCGQAGSEFCDFECPNMRALRSGK